MDIQYAVITDPVEGFLFQARLTYRGRTYIEVEQVGSEAATRQLKNMKESPSADFPDDPEYIAQLNAFGKRAAIKLIDRAVVENPAPPMTREELLRYLAQCARDGDKERAHFNADDALLKFINDPRITEAFNSFEKWYA